MVMTAAGQQRSWSGRGAVSTLSLHHSHIRRRPPLVTGNQNCAPCRSSVGRRRSFSRSNHEQGSAHWVTEQNAAARAAPRRPRDALSALRSPCLACQNHGNLPNKRTGRKGRAHKREQENYNCPPWVGGMAASHDCGRRGKLVLNVIESIITRHPGPLRVTAELR